MIQTAETFEMTDLTNKIYNKSEEPRWRSLQPLKKIKMTSATTSKEKDASKSYLKNPALKQL